MHANNKFRISAFRGDAVFGETRFTVSVKFHAIRFKTLKNIFLDNL